MSRTPHKGRCQLCVSRLRFFVKPLKLSSAIDLICPSCLHGERLYVMDLRLFSILPTNWVAEDVKEEAPW
jgi:hypothetical protein